MRDEFIAWVQSRLTAHGFTPGPIDGIDGERTRAAIRAFEARHGVHVDGIADSKVVTMLRASATALTPREMLSVPPREAISPGANLDTSWTPAHEPPAAMKWPRQSGVENRFGKPGENLTLAEFPYEMFLAWDKSSLVRKFSINKECAASAVRVLEAVEKTYSRAERDALGLNLFGGCFNIRRMRGGSKLSMHSYGIAIDFDPVRNTLRQKRTAFDGMPPARLSHADAVPFWKEWEREGWISLGRARDFDWMHVQAARL